VYALLSPFLSSIEWGPDAGPQPWEVRCIPHLPGLLLLLLLAFLKLLPLTNGLVTVAWSVKKVVEMDQDCMGGTRGGMPYGGRAERHVSKIFYAVV
jgi:hypothetical protein